MTIDPTATQNAGATGATASDSKAGKSKGKLASDMDVFLLMLTTQLRNQDPLSPMDSNEFTNQLVQFSSVEQQIDANANLERMIAMQQASQMSSAVGYMGTNVEFKSEVLPLQGQRAEFAYELTEPAESVTIRILDPVSGQVVRTMQGDPMAGAHPVVWNGLDDDGRPLPDGAYKVAVTARKGLISSPVATTVTGTVTGIASDEGKVILSLSSVEVPLDDIKRIRQPAPPASGA